MPAGRIAVPESALAVLADFGAPLTSTGTPGPAVPATPEVRGVVRTLAPHPLVDDEAGLTRGGSRDVLLTLRGAVALASGQRVTLAAGTADAATYTVQGPAETRGPEWDGWLVIEVRVRPGGRR